MGGMIDHCKDCRFFGEPVKTMDPDGEFVETSFHVCGYVEHAADTLFGWDTNVAVEDGSGYFARLVVRGDFGCVHFEARAGAPA